MSSKAAAAAAAKAPASPGARASTDSRAETSSQASTMSEEKPEQPDRQWRFTQWFQKVSVIVSFGFASCRIVA